jgi:hypothetical protein
MRTTRATWAAVTIGALLSCHGTPPEPPGTVTSGIAGMDDLVNIGIFAAGLMIEKYGLLDATGGGGPDPWTMQKLEEISRKLDRLQANLDAVREDTIGLQDFAEMQERLDNVDAAYTHIADTCYRDTLRATALSVDLAPDVRNAELLARAREIVGQTVPAGLPERCNIRNSLNTIRNALVVPDPLQGPMLTKMARWARSQSIPFETVAKYFVWAVGTERLAMSIVAEARHRLGQDNDLAAELVDLRESLREQEIELLRAAEAYAEFVEQYRPPFAPLAPSDLTLAFDAFELADLVVAAMEGTPRFVTATLVQGYPQAVRGDPTFDYRVPIAVPQITVPGGSPVPLGDTLAAADGKQGYGLLSARSLEALNGDPFEYPYVLPLKPGEGVEVGWGTEVQFTRWLTTEVPFEAIEASEGSPGTVTVSAVSGWPEPTRVLALALRNAVTLRPEPEADNPRDRQLLAHENARGLAVSRLKLLPSGEDPRRVTLAVDLPSRGLADVPLRAVSGGFAARDDDGAGEPLAVEVVPLGPAEPERVRLKLGEGRWLGISAPAASGAFATVVEVATSPEFTFELVRADDAYEVSWFDADDVRRFLYVNEQFLSAHDGQFASADTHSYLFHDHPEVLRWIDPFPGDLIPPIGFYFYIRNGTQTAVDYALYYVGYYSGAEGWRCTHASRGTEYPACYFYALPGWEYCEYSCNEGASVAPGDTDWLMCLTPTAINNIAVGLGAEP